MTYEAEAGIQHDLASFHGANRRELLLPRVATAPIKKY